MMLGSLRWMWLKLLGVPRKEVNTVTTESKSQKVGRDAEYMHALLNHRSPAVITKTLQNTVSDYSKLSKNEQELLKANLAQLSPNCIACMAVGNRKAALRRTSRMKRTEQNVNSLMVE